MTISKLGLRIEEEKLLAMRIHESFELDNGSIDILRVVGGWIYTSYNFNIDGCFSTTFVKEN